MSQVPVTRPSSTTWAWRCRAQVGRQGVDLGPRLEAVRRRGLDDEVLLVVHDVPVVGDVQQDTAVVGGRVAGEGLGAQVEGEAGGRRLADDASQEEGGR